MLEIKKSVLQLKNFYVNVVKVINIILDCGDIKKNA